MEFQHNTYPNLILQGFTSDCQKTHNKKWYKILLKNIDKIECLNFQAIWLPPPSMGGYHPSQWFSYDGSYGKADELYKLNKELKIRNIMPIADVVINHRNGYRSWGNFKNPDFGIGYKSIVSNDEFFTKGPGKKIPQHERGNHKDGNVYTFWNPCRNLDHNQQEVRFYITMYLENLKVMGFEGWRFDVAGGYDAQYMMEYIDSSKAKFSVSEYWEGDSNKLKDFCEARYNKTTVFDFGLFYSLKNAIHNSDFTLLTKFPIGLVSLNQNQAVTFVENHDTIQHDGYKSFDQILAGYAYILSHPGIPTVYWQHLFIDNEQINQQLGELVYLREMFKINRNSQVRQIKVEKEFYLVSVDDKIIVGLGEFEKYKNLLNNRPVYLFGNLYSISLY